MHRCPHPELLQEFKSREAEVLAGRADAEGLEEGRGALDDGWGQLLSTLEDFPYERYGIEVKA
jgi:pseudouridine-5'-monophosphatase